MGFRAEVNENSYSRFITVLITQTLTFLQFLTMVKNLYAVWIKIDETLPWIELKGEYQTRREAKKAAKEFHCSTKTKIVRFPEKSRSAKAIVSAKVTR